MPFEWTEPDQTEETELTLWPHQSLPPRGLAFFVLITFAMIMLPLFGLLGTSLLWALLPFLLMAVGGIWFALNRSRLDRSIVETLTITPARVTLARANPKAPDQNWSCNSYWVKPTLHQTEGPVPNYITLQGNGRIVELGSFLSEEERVILFNDLKARLKRVSAQ